MGDNNGDAAFTSADVPTNSGEVWIKGNVGIGKMLPSNAKLDILESASGAYGIILTNRNSNQIFGIAVDAAAVDDKKFSIIDVTNSAIRMVIDNSGHVGIGLTGPTYQLQLSTDSAAKPTTNTWTIASDKRIKKNISDFTDGLNVVMKLKPRTYQYNGLGGKGYDDTDTHIGFVAQEVEPVAPYMVETNKGTIGGVQVNDFKNYQGHALSFILVNAIQEQQAIIKAQQSEINELKARLDKLEKKQTKSGK